MTETVVENLGANVVREVDQNGTVTPKFVRTKTQAESCDAMYAFERPKWYVS